MPKRLHDLAKKMEKHMPSEMAWAIATSQLQKKGVLKKKVNRGGRKK